MECQIHKGDAKEVLKTMETESISCCVASPPYYGLRDYGIEGQIDREVDLQAYIENLVDVFTEVHRVLRNDGTFWLNLGDSYARDTKWGGSSGGKHAQGLHG